MTETVDEGQPKRAEYPYVWAMLNAIFILLAVGAVIDPAEQPFWPKVTGSAALLAAGLKQGVGYPVARSQAGRIFTIVFVALDVLLIGLIWTVR